MKKYIFLDIDGVIGNIEESIENGEDGLIDQKQDLLGVILQETDAEIVLTSSWRLHTLEETKEYMTTKGFRYSDKIVGITIRAYHYITKGIHLSIPRGVEIKQWVDTHIHSDNGKNFKFKEFRYVILDDDSDMLLEHKDNFVRTNSNIGLTTDDIIKSINILNNL